MKRKLKQNIALFSTLALLMTPGVVLAADPTPTPTPPESPAAGDKITLTLDKTQLELTVGETATITATVTNATDTNVSFESLDTNVIKVERSSESSAVVTAVGEGKAEIRAKSNAGDFFASCMVTVKAQNIDIEITALNLSVGTLDKPFNSGNKDYTITIPEDVNTLNLFQTITLNVDKKAAGLRVTGDSNLVNSSVIQVFVNDESEARHTFTVIKEKKQPVDLSLKSLRVTGYTLDQAFDPNTLTYTLTIPYEAQDVTIQAAAASSEASVSVSGATGLEVGKSVVTVTVSDADGNKREYKITVTREAETEENEEEENISSTSSSTSNQTSKDVHEDNRKDRTLQYVLVSIGCLILFLIGGFGIYFYIKTSKKKKGNGKDKDKKGNNNQEEQSTTDKEMTSASTNDSSTATSNQVDENQSNIEEENSTASQAETELSEEESKRLSDLEETKEFYLDKEKKKIEPAPKAEQEEKRKDDVLKDIEELFDDD
jgi:Ig domain protein group 2 domain protein